MDENNYIKTVQTNIGGVLSRIRTAAEGRQVELLLATKTVKAEVINELSAFTGHALIGENKVQELLEKYDLLEKERLTIHLIGHLQTNKVKYIIDKVKMIHSLDRIELAAEIAKRARAKGLTMEALVEINIARESEKSGVYPEDVAEFVKSVSSLDGLKIKGLMTMAPAKITSEEYKMYFGKTKVLFDEIKALNIPNVDMDVLSMGMSDSYEEGAACGATMVRVGSAVFGKRIYPEKQAD